MPMRIPEAPRQFEYVNPDNGGVRLQPMRVTTSEAMFGATGAQALAQAGKDLRAFGAGLREDVERRDRAVAEEAFAQRQKEETAWRLEQNKRRGRNALGAADGSSLSVADASRQWASEARRRFTENMSPYQKRLFISLADRADTQLFAWAGSKEQQEDQVWRTSLWQGTAEEASNRAASMFALGDMDAFRSSLAEVQHAVRQMGAMQGWDAKYTDQKALDTIGGALLPIGQTLIADGNLRGAQAFIKEHAPALGAKRVLSLQNAVKAEQRRRAAEARAAAREARINARLDLAQRTQDAVASWMNGAHYENAPQRNDFIAVYGEKNGERLWTEMEDKRRLGQDLQDLRTMTPGEQATFLETRKPDEGEGYAERLKNYKFLETALAQDAKQREKDPVAYLTAFDPKVKQARQQLFSAMTPENVQAYAMTVRTSLEARGITPSPNHPLPLLSEADAHSLASSIISAPDQAAMLTQLQQAFGSHWPALERQLTTGEKLPSDISVVASGMTGRPARLLLRIAGVKDFVTGAKHALGPEYKIMQEFVSTELEQFDKTIQAQGVPQIGFQFREATEKLAAQYMQEGSTPKDAARKAAEDVINKRYTYKKTYRVPTSVDADLVDRGAQKALARLSLRAEELQLPAFDVEGLDQKAVAQRFGGGIGRGGEWVTNADESGLMLFLYGIPVRNKDGSLVQRTWAQLIQESSDTGVMSPAARETLEELMNQ